MRRASEDRIDPHDARGPHPTVWVKVPPWNRLITGGHAVEGHDLFRYLHVLMFVFWLGTDMGVFLSARKSTDPSLSFGSRVLLLHMALRIELLPRTMWKAALPLGVVLSRQLDLLPISDLGLALVWAFSIVWWGISMTGAWYYDRPFGHTLGRITNWLTGLVGVTLIVLAMASFLGHGPFVAEATWLQWKVGLYGLINLMVVMMIKAFDPMGAAFGRLAVEGSTPEIEASITATMNRSAAIIWATYTTIALVAFIAVTRFI